MNYQRVAIEVESPEEVGYDNIKYNLTESSFADMAMSELDFDLKNLMIAYCDHKGKRELREAIALDSGLASRDNILITGGAAGALFIVATSLLKPEDHVVIIRPNYGLNLETPRAIGCQVDIYDLTFEEGFTIDPARVAAMLHPKTKCISITMPHNPTGVVWSETCFRQLVSLAENRGMKLIVDETYRDMTYAKPLPVGASVSSSVISVSSLSKSYGLPGIRIGWIATQDKALMEIFLAAKEQIVICNSIIDEEIAWQVYRRKDEILKRVRTEIAARFEIMKTWYRGQEEFEWIEPSGGVVAFPRIKPSLRVDLDLFYKTLKEKYGTYIGPGHWFEQDRRFIRIGFAWTKERADLSSGLKAITASVREAMI
jgi:aspartate/methionine/tyrosine aminotransferase